MREGIDSQETINEQGRCSKVAIDMMQHLQNVVTI